MLGTTLGHDNCFGAVKGKVRAGDMTFFRISTDDVHRRSRPTSARDGSPTTRSTCPARSPYIQVPELSKLLRYMVENGFEHHVSMAREHCADVIEEVLETYLGWSFYQHP